MAENQVNTITDYREQIARLRNAFTILRCELNARIDAEIAKLERLEDEGRTQSRP